MKTPRIVHVVGTGTLGEPLIGLLLRLQTGLGVDAVTFDKHTPRVRDRFGIQQLIHLGGALAVEPDKRADFEKLGLQPTLTRQEALAQAGVVIDCTAEGLGCQHKAEWYQHLPNAHGFIAQGSETGFGKPYAYGINDTVLTPGEDRFIQVVSCNTHNLAALIHTLALAAESPDNLIEGRFVCMRRATDIGQETGFIPSPDVGVHSDPTFGTHHARDAWRLFHTLGADLNLFSSAIKLNTPYMHTIWFTLRVRRAVSREDVLAKLHANPQVAMTEKTMSSPVFSFGRDHGYFGRLLNQTVVSAPSVNVRDGHDITGFCFTPQDGNSLMSSLAATAWLLNPDTHLARMQILTPYLFDEI